MLSVIYIRYTGQCVLSLKFVNIPRLGHCFWVREYIENDESINAEIRPHSLEMGLCCARLCVCMLAIKAPGRGAAADDK